MPAAWRKSSACLPSECVEVSATAGYVLIRDSADKSGGLVLALSRTQWHAFTGHLRRQGAQQGKRDATLTSAVLCLARAEGCMAYSGTSAG